MTEDRADMLSILDEESIPVHRVIDAINTIESKNSETPSVIILKDGVNTDWDLLVEQLSKSENQEVVEWENLRSISDVPSTGTLYVNNYSPLNEEVGQRLIRGVVQSGKVSGGVTILASSPPTEGSFSPESRWFNGPFERGAYWGIRKDENGKIFIDKYHLSQGDQAKESHEVKE